METHKFTPRLSSTDHRRIEMQLSAQDIATIGRGKWRAIVTDQNTGIQYRVRGAACGIPNCMCDAVILGTL